MRTSNTLSMGMYIIFNILLTGINIPTKCVYYQVDRRINKTEKKTLIMVCIKNPH